MIISIYVFLDYFLLEEDMIVYDNKDADEFANDAIDNTEALWPLDSASGTVRIPYMIDNSIALEMQLEIDRAISEFHQKTCIR